MKACLIILVLFSLNSSLAQVELVAKIDQNLNSHFNTDSPFYFTSSRIFSVFDGYLYHINQENKNRELIPFQSQWIKSAFATNDGIYITLRENTIPGKLRLMKVDNNLNVTEVFAYSYLSGSSSFNYDSRFIHRIGDFLYFHIRSPNGNLIYRTYINSGVVEEVESYSASDQLKVVGSTESYFIYSVRTDDTTKLFKIQNSQIDYITEGEFSSELISGSNGISYLRAFLADSHCDYFKFNTATNSFGLYMTDTVSNRKFESIIPYDNYFVLSMSTSYQSNHFKAFDNSGTLEISNESIVLKDEYILPTNYGNQARLISQNHPMFSFANKDLGGELFSINAEDSLSLIQDFNSGKWGAFTYSDCSQLSFGYSSVPRVFSYTGKDYAVLTNGNDPFFYLHEIDANGFHCNFKVEDYHSRIEFLPQEEYLYYFVHDQTEGRVKLYRVKWEDMNDQQPDEKVFDEDAWSTQIAYLRTDKMCEYSAINMRSLDVCMNDASETVVSLINMSFGDLYLNEINETKNNLQIETDVNHQIFKYNQYGKVLWSNSIGDKTKLYADKDQILIDDDDNIQVFGTLFKKGFFDGDSLIMPGSARYYAKLDGETGKILNKRILFETNYVDDTQFLSVCLGENNSTYVGGKYLHFSQDFGDTTLISDLDFQNFLAKYDYDGNIIWIRNIHNSWTDVSGEIQKIDFNETTGEIGVFCSQNYNSVCDELPWKGEIILYNTYGKETKRKGLDGKYVHRGGSFVFGEEGSILLSGSYAGNLSAGVYENATNKTDDCYEPASYVMKLDTKQNRFTSGQYSLQSAVTFEQTVKGENFNYFIGKNGLNGKLTIVRFDQKGNYHGEKELNQKPAYYNINYSDGYFALSMVEANAEDYLNLTYSFLPYSSQYKEILTLVRFKVEDWAYSSTYESMDVKFVDQDLGTWAFPNPSYDNVQINFEDDQHQFETYYVCDAMGRIVASGGVPNQNFMVLSIDNLEFGLYHVVFIGDKVKKTIKIMRQN